MSAATRQQSRTSVGDRAVVGDLGKDSLQALFTVGANLQQGMAGVVPPARS